ncbi:MAG TPA: NERD domain-containing protein [Leucothrix mucor]|uniref:NERD domain-containing protein n=1 Tax=Leucothrix mucor TaxID=45248 RepID=A0A7V2T4F4_LEUMU|nr:NERD domain-containing protein [Leucothrix mucor]
MKFLKGWFGEKKTTFNMWLSLDSGTYQRFHDVIIPARNGTTQIDHILVSPYGLFIIETKNLKGWIFGSEDQAKWTQSLYGKNYSFQNPLRQTYRQKKVLSEFLQISEDVIHTVIYFAGQCKFKTKMPCNVLRSGLSKYIKKHKNRELSQESINDIVRTLNNHVSGNKITKRDHVKSLKARHSSTTICPKCGSNLVERTARKGPNAGKKFLGCEGFPKCKYTTNA